MEQIVQILHATLFRLNSICGMRCDFGLEDMTGVTFEFFVFVVCSFVTFVLA